MAVLARNWWTLLIRGLLAIAVGVIAFVRPELTVRALVLVFAVYAIVNGVMALIAAIRGAQRGERWGMLLLEGIAGVGAGAIALFWPGITLLALIALIAAWAVLSGVFEIAAAIRLRKEITGEWLLALAGIVTLGFGVLLVVFPSAGALALVLLVGLYAVLFGATLVALSFRLRSWQRMLGGGGSTYTA